MPRLRDDSLYDAPALYDALNADRVEDVKFYVRRAREATGPILEIGGGTGRVAIPIAQARREVVCLERVPAMLAQARSRAVAANVADRIRFVEADMRTFDLGERFDLVIAPYSVLLHLVTAEDFVACFRAVRAHLAPGGRFLFDVWCPDLRALSRNPTREYLLRKWRHPTLGYTGRSYGTFAYDDARQMLRMTVHRRPDPGAPDGVRETQYTLTQRQLFPEELRALLTLGGLAIHHRWGDLTRRRFRAGDPAQIVLAGAADEGGG